MSVITERIVTQGHGPLSPSYVCVHSTSNPGATAADHARYWAGAGADMAVHLVSDWTECLHTVPYDRLCWQVGNGNSYVEGIEICEATTQEAFDAGIRIAARAVRERLAAHGWGVDRLISHDDARRQWGGTDHTDPTGYLAKWGWTFEKFKALVAEGDTDMALTDDDILRIWTHQLPNGRAARDIISDSTSDIIRMHDSGITAGQWVHQLPNGRKARDIISDATSDIIRIHDTMIPQLTAQVTALTAAVETLSRSLGADPDAIATAVRDAVTAKLDALEITVTATDKG